MNYSKSQTQTKYSYDLGLLKLIKFNKRSTELFYASKPEGMGDKEWAIDPSNPNRLPEKEQAGWNVLDEMNHKSGKGTFCRQHWLARRLGVSIETIRLWLRKWKFLGIITVEKRFHYKWINSYTVTAKFTKYLCEADRILAPCTKEDHSQCVRPAISYTCTSCHRFMGGMSIEQQHQRDIDTITSALQVEINSRDEKISELEKELAKAKAYKQVKAKVREDRRQSKAKVRENFLSKLKEEEKAVVHTYEAITGRPFDVEKDLKALNRINKNAPLTAIIGILQTAINLLAQDKEEGKSIKSVDINQAVKKAAIYSLQYCVGQVEKVGKEISSAFGQLGKQTQPSEALMGYLGTVVATLDAKTALEMMGIIKAMPAKALGGEAGIKACLGIFASKMVSRHVKAGLLAEEDRADAFNEYLASLLAGFSLRC